MTTSIIHTWFITKWHKRRADVGVFNAAVQMRKQGVPLSVALFTLVHAK